MSDEPTVIIPDPDGEGTEIKSGTNVRLLICRACGTVNRLKDYQGDPEYDWELREIIERHLGKASDPRPESHPAQLMVVDEKALEKMDDATLKKSLEDNLDMEISEFRDDFKEQAMQCYALHNRPKGGCIDYCDESRVIGRKTGIAAENRAYLCHYCPVQVWVENKQNEASGLFKGYKWK